MYEGCLFQSMYTFLHQMCSFSQVMHVFVLNPMHVRSQQRLRALFTCWHRKGWPTYLTCVRRILNVAPRPWKYSLESQSTFIFYVRHFAFGCSKNASLRLEILFATRRTLNLIISSIFRAVRRRNLVLLDVSCPLGQPSIHVSSPVLHLAP